jgi:hypothetical protein
MAKQLNPGQLIFFATALLTLFSVVFAGLFRRFDTLILGLGVALIGYGFEQNKSAILLITSVAIFLGSYLPFGLTSSYVIQGFSEGFEDEEKDSDKEKFDGKRDADTEEEEKEEEGDNFENPDDSDEEDFANYEGFANDEEKKKKKKRVPPPDNGSRAEMFELGKKYKMPKETDDPEYHLDAGTTFLNAYKSLKPDQISAMTKDTQDLIDTQKQLMTTLNTLKPLITDGKQMMDTFQQYFGAAGAGNIGDLSKMAEKFAN